MTYQSFSKITASITAADTWTSLTVDMLNNTTAEIQVPKWANYITKIKAVSSCVASAANACTIIGLKIGGDAIGNKTIEMPILAVQGTGTSVTGPVAKAFTLDTCIPVNAGSPISMQGVMSGSDLGAIEISASLGFSDSDFGRKHVLGIMSREGQHGTVNTFTRLAGDYAAGTRQDIIVPIKASMIAQTIAVTAAGSTAKGCCHSYKLDGNGVLPGAQTWVGISKYVGGTDTSTQIVTPEVDDVAMQVNPGDSITVYADMAGADSDAGTPESALALVFV